MNAGVFQQTRLAGLMGVHISDSKLIKEVAEFKADQANSESSASSGAAALMSMLSKECTAGRSASSSSVATGEGLPALPKRIVDKILRGEYVDFAAAC